MFRTFKTLFRRSTRRSTVRTAKPAVRRARLFAEPLEDRALMSITPTLVNGTLGVIGNAANDNAVVVYPSNGTTSDTTRINVYDRTTGILSSFSAAQVERIVMDGGDGNDQLYNMTAKPATLRGGNGNDGLNGGTGSDVLDGGTGDDWFVTSAGADVYTGGAGNDILYRVNGNHGYFADNNTTDGDLTTGLASTATRFTPEELRANGNLTVSPDAADARKLLFVGPGGAGFALPSSAPWVRTGNAFSTTGQITVGSVTLTGTLTVNVEASPYANAAKYSSIALGGVPLTDFANPLDGLINQASGVNIGVSTPGMKWGIALGSGVKALDGSAPLNNSVPYFYLTGSSGFSVSYGGFSAATPSFGGTLAYSPADGIIYGGVSGLPVLSDIGFAMSTQGYVPYTPKHIPDGLTDPNLFGHAYIRLGGSLEAVPVGLKGEMLLDLDANDDGSLLGLTKDNITKAVNSYLSTARTGDLMSAIGSAALNDLAVGFNGELSLEVADFLSVKLGEASGWYKPGQAAFRAQVLNPFAGTVLEPVISGNPADFQAYYDWSNAASPKWSLKATAGGVRVLGVDTGTISIEAGSAVIGGHGLSFRTSSGNGSYGSQTAGWIDFSTGNFDVNGRSWLYTSGSNYHLNTQFSFDIRQAGGVISTTSVFSIDFAVDWSGLSVSLRGSDRFSVTTASLTTLKNSGFYLGGQQYGIIRLDLYTNKMVLRIDGLSDPLTITW